uniref:Serrate RNA effector molecule n=1 Tax=Rhizophora mucronata TaxID=61149 RepID=A0A2P2ML30_RHIMU
MRRGSCRKADDKRMGAGPLSAGTALPFLPPASNGGGPLCSLNICIATSGGAGTNGPSGPAPGMGINTGGGGISEGKG